jgi:hypothetical protein
MNTLLHRAPLRMLAAVVASATIAGATLATAGLLVPEVAGAYTPVAPWEPLPSNIQAGGLLFFNAAGDPITSGSINTSPFAAYVEGTSVLNASDKAATIYAAAPKHGEPQTEWGSEALGGTTTYPNADAPAPIKTSKFPVYTGSVHDTDIASFLSAFSNSTTPTWGGLYVIRLKTSNPSATTTYDSADIKVVGTTWSVVYPTSVTTVAASPASPQDYGTTVKFTATITPSSATGSVQFLNRTTDIGSAVTVHTGKASINVSTLQAGTAIINAVFTPTVSGTSSGSIGNTVFAVDSVPTTTTLITTPATSQTVGQNVKLKASVTPPAATGKITFKNGTATLATETLVAGTASFTDSALALGPHSLSAVFKPSSVDYGTSTGHATLDITKITTTTKLTAAPVSPQFVGTPVTFTATVTPHVAGTVEFKVGSTVLGTKPVTVGSGTAALQTSALPVGTDTVVAAFTPASGTYAGSSKTIHYTVKSAESTTTTLSTLPATSQTFGQNVKLTASVTPSAAPGKITFKNGTTVLATKTVVAGTATFTTASLAVGAHALSAVYTPSSGDYLTSTGHASLTITKIPTTTKLTAVPVSPQFFGTSVTLTATVTPHLAGTVEFKVGSTVLGTKPVTVGSGTASLQTSALPVGTDAVLAAFTPTSGDYATSTKTIHYTVKALTATTTKLTPSPASPQVYGTTVTLKATVTPVTAPGTVEFKVGSTVLGTKSVAGGTASISTTALPVGSDTLTALFTPTADSGFKSSSGTSPYTVDPISTRTALTATPPSPQVFGTTVTLKATVTPATAPGTVQFKAGSTVLGTKSVTGGTASLKTTALPVGGDTLTATFTPSSGNFAASSKTATYTINPIATTTVLTASPASPQFAGTVITLRAVVTPPVATGSVEFKVGSTVLGTQSVSGGVASLPTAALPVGSDTLVAIFTPSTADYSGSTGTASFTVKAVTSTTTKLSTTPSSPQTYGTSITLTATVSPSAAPGSVQFFVGGTAIGAPVAVAGGVASTTTTTLPPGADALSAEFTPAAGSGFGGSTGTASFTVSGHSGTGYWLVASDGGIFSFGSAVFYGSMGGQPLNKPIVGIAATPDGKGYWEVASDGGIFSFGDAVFYGSEGGKPLNAPIIAISATPDGKGYWEVASDGGIFAFGDAVFYGSEGGQPLNQAIVGMTATPDGMGYWEVASDGGIFAFGDAVFYGSTGSLTLAQPVVGMVPTPDGLGYWLAAADGGLFAFGDATFYGSVPAANVHVTNVVGITATSDGRGYWEVATDGGIYAFGDAVFYGSMGGQPLNKPIVGMTET